MDPLSITAGTLSLLGVCAKVGWGLKTFRDGAALADTKVTSLITDVESFSRVLQLMKDTFEQKSVQASLRDTGHIGSHWRNLAASIRDGSKILEQLEQLLEKVNKSVKVLSGSRKHYRLMEAAEEIVMYQEQIRAYRDTLQLSLQTVILWNQVTFKDSTDQIIPNLDGLHKEIRRLAFDFNSQMSSLQNLVQQNASNDQLENLTHLRNCVQSAATVVSSATTIMGIEPDQGEGSEFGDCFPPEPSESMLRWMSAKTVYDFGEEAETEGRAGRTSITDDAGADSDDDLEFEIFQALLKRGTESEVAGEFSKAESLLKNCLSRLPRATYRDSKLQVQRRLGHVYIGQEDWAAASTLFKKDMEMEFGDVSGYDADRLADLLTLASVLFKQGEFTEAKLYGRKALKAYRRRGSASSDAVIHTLKILMTICAADGNNDEVEAYYSMLMGLSKGKEIEGSHSVAGAAVRRNAPRTYENTLRSSTVEQQRLDSGSRVFDTPSSSSIERSMPILATTRTNTVKVPDVPITFVSHLPVFSQPNSRARRTVILVGDRICRISTLIETITTGNLPSEPNPTAYETQYNPIVGSQFRLTLRGNIMGHEDWDGMRSIYFGEIHVSIICISIGHRDSVENAREQWIENVWYYIPKRPIIILGLKLDLRNDLNTIRKLAKRKLTPVSREEGEQLALELGALKYLECSAKTGEGLTEAMYAISEIALAQPDRMPNEEKMPKEEMPKEEKKKRKMSDILGRLFIR